MYTNNKCIYDAREKLHNFTVAPKRIISLVPSLTDTVIDLGLGNNLVGVTDFCHLPKSIKNVERLGGPLNPDINKIISYNPDIILANKEENSKKIIYELDNYIPIYVTHPITIKSVKDLLNSLGTIFDRNVESLSIINEINYLECKLKYNKKSFNFVYLVWKNPYMVVGKNTYINNLLELIGGINVFKIKNNKDYFVVSIEEIIKSNPDFIFIPDEPYKFTEEDFYILYEELNKNFDIDKIIGVNGYLINYWGSKTPRAINYLLDKFC